MANNKQLTLARAQYILSKEGAAKNQCKQCGVYRLDAEPPSIHEPFCDNKEIILYTTNIGLPFNIRLPLL